MVFAPRAAVVGHFFDDRLVLKYMFNTGYRRPNFWQSQWPNGLFGTQRAATSPEYAPQPRSAVRAGAFEAVKLDLVLFRQDMAGVILSTLTEDGSRKTWKNVGTFSSDGVEASSDVLLFGASQAGANFTWTRKARLTSAPRASIRPSS